jgi:catechol 2,3-dioxygenase-like lactoylglutathione lyase family enzyme
MRVNHVGVTVSDLGRSTAWYEDVLGAEPKCDPYAMDDGTQVMFVGLPAYEVELIQPGHPLPPEAVSADTPAAFHIGTGVDDIERAYARAVDHGAAAISEPAKLQGVTAFFLTGPDGELVQISGAAPFPLEHVGFNVPDLREAEEWSRRHLSLSPSAHAVLGGEVALAMGGPAAEISISVLSLGASFIELVEWSKPVVPRADPSFKQIGSWHLCLDVEDPAGLQRDIATQEEEIVVPLLTLDRGPNRGLSTFFTRGPGQTLVQFQSLA